MKIAAEKSGRIDVLVNNAAHLGDWLDVQEATPEQWDHSYSITLKGAVQFHACGFAVGWYETRADRS